MSNKITNVFQNLFSKSRTNKNKLATDAAPVSHPTIIQPTSSESRTNTNTAMMIPSLSPTNLSMDESPFAVERQLSNVSTASSIPSDSLEPFPSRGLQQQITNSSHQAYSVYQFTNVNGLHIGSVYNINSPQSPAANRDRRPKTGEPIRKTKSIDAMMKSAEELTHRACDVIATHLGEGWRNVIRELGFSDGRIEQMYEENQVKGIREVIYQFLLEFSRNDDNANLGNVSRLLWKCGHKETVFILKEYWKNGELRPKNNGTDTVFDV